MNIQIFEEDRKLPSFFRKKPIYECITKIVHSESHKEISFISIIFCSDEYLLHINNTFLQHDYYTDVITFDYSPSHIESDIFISLDRFIEYAIKNSVSLLS